LSVGASDTPWRGVRSGPAKRAPGGMLGSRGGRVTHPLRTSRVFAYAEHCRKQNVW
jgi:hypothetical protein